MNSIVSASGVSPNVVDLCFQFQSNPRSIASVRTVHLDSSSVLPWQDVLEASADSDGTNLDGDSQVIEAGVIEDHKADVEALRDILSCITVPVRETSDTGSVAMTVASAQTKYRISNGQVLDFFNDDEIRRHFIAAGEDLKEAAIRITRCAAW